MDIPPFIYSFTCLFTDMQIISRLGMSQSALAAVTKYPNSIDWVARERQNLYSSYF